MWSFFSSCLLNSSPVFFPLVNEKDPTWHASFLLHWFINEMTVVIIFILNVLFSCWICFCKYIILWNVSVEQIGAMCVWVCVWDWFWGNIAADGQRHVRMQRFRWNELHGGASRKHEESSVDSFYTKHLSANKLAHMHFVLPRSSVPVPC